MHCIADPNEIKLRGNFLQAVQGTVFTAIVVKCEGEDYCATIDECNEYAD